METILSYLNTPTQPPTPSGMENDCYLTSYVVKAQCGWLGRRYVCCLHRSSVIVYPRLALYQVNLHSVPAIESWRPPKYKCDAPIMGVWNTWSNWTFTESRKFAHI